MSRRKGRYERRKTRREENRLRRAAAVGGLHDVFGYDDITSLFRLTETPKKSWL